MDKLQRIWVKIPLPLKTFIFFISIVTGTLALFMASLVLASCFITNTNTHKE